MRPIKFRAWDKKNGRWFKPTIDENGIVIVDERHEEPCPHCGDTVYGIHPIEYPNDYELMQFTGLLDKNGKEIYEGDILIDSYGEADYLPILYDGNGFWLKEPSGTKHLPEEKYREIVGNIYENPELL